MTLFEKELNRVKAAGDVMTDTQLSTERIYQIGEKIYGEREDPIYIFELHNAEITGSVTVLAGYLFDMADNTDDYASIRFILSRSSLMYQAEFNGKTFTGEFSEGGDRLGEDI
jgi:hypothetical protein